MGRVGVFERSGITRNGEGRQGLPGKGVSLLFVFERSDGLPLSSTSASASPSPCVDRC